MRQSRSTATEIIYAVKQVELGIPVRGIARKYGVGDRTVYLSRREYNGVSPSELKRCSFLSRRTAGMWKRWLIRLSAAGLRLGCSRSGDGSGLIRRKAPVRDSCRRVTRVNDL